MKSLVAFYSRTGITKKTAEAVAKALGADIDEIIDEKDRKGIAGYLGGGRDALQKKQTGIAFKKSPGKYDLVIIGTPVWGARMTPAIRTYIERHKKQLGNSKVAFFCTMGGSGYERTIEEMGLISGKKPHATMAVLTREVVKDAHGDKVKLFVEEIKKK